MKRLTVKQVAKLSGVSVRTLHHYDEIGLLRPAFIGDNRYRYYGEEQLLRLQQILFHREFGIPLAEIAALLDRPDFDRLAALRAHRARLTAEAERCRELIETIDRTIAGLQGDRTMKMEELYKGFSPEKQAEHEDWLIREYGEGMRARIETSRAHLSGLSAEQHQALMAELAECEQGLAEAQRQGVPPESEQLTTLLDRHRAWVGSMWGRPSRLEAYAGLADLYLSHPDFIQRYETIEPGFATYLTTAMKAYVERSRK